MNTSTKVISLVGLLATIVPCVLFFFGIIGHEAVKLAALIGTIVWFISTPFWMNRKLGPDADRVEI
ncbi:hypothetical protein LF1_13070 [Rubripirellula obstinata]|uniref:Uncharacterized protein n=1 Tax=Rubripirellula obstinata TaxID=406547 RepID=A0A5B1CHQ5_9BACT|nr:hypothetical protein [Rubripirellula obstinata]KAA1258784.1 hypothetical protein LF1_13070 [Rubripirellula obstinata]